MENKNLAILLPVNFEGERPTVSGRELHAALGIETPYHKWFPRMCEYGFMENEDYTTMDKIVHRADGSVMPQTQHDHQLTIPMAKELCMLQRNEKGKMFRQYFIEIENAWNTPEMVMGRALHIADAKIKMLTATVSDLNHEIEEAKPKVEFYNAVADTKDCLKVRAFSKLCYKDGMKIGQNKLFKWFRANHYMNANNEPYQQYINAGYFTVHEHHFFVNGEPRVSITPYITGKGQQYFLKKLRKSFKQDTPDK